MKDHEMHFDPGPVCDEEFASMKILITGNMGYVGPVIVTHLRKMYPEARLLGADTGYFAGCLTTADHALPETLLDLQIFEDVRVLDPNHLSGVDGIVHLCAISNDPMGTAFAEVTSEVNHQASIRLAVLAKQAGVRSFVFASSCSVYGYSEDGATTESSPVRPLTAYARSKVAVERELEALSGDGFQVSCLRFATACGMSPRLRLDLVLNDFVASALATHQITILSDGSPWRPLIDVHDMARAIGWALQRPDNDRGPYLVVNVGSNSWNYQVRDLACAVQRAVPDVDITINPEAKPDRRSYRVNFDLFERLARGYLPIMELETSIRDLKDGLEAIGFTDPAFRESTLIRLRALGRLRSSGLLTDELYWTTKMKA